MPLEDKKINLEESLYANIPGSQEKLQKLRELEHEKQLVLSEITKRCAYKVKL
jgi:YbbR domain-containing protein